MKEEEQEASAMSDETVAAARFVSVVCECVSRVSRLLGSQRNGMQSTIMKGVGL